MALRSNKFAFTLIELIIVITILVILGTIAFISFSGYQSSARDSGRVSDISNITKALEIQIVKSGVSPIPVNPIVFGSGASMTITAGKINSSILSSLSPGAKDPLTGTEYSYSVINNGQYYQVGTELENPLSFSTRLPGFIGIDRVYADSNTKIAKINGNYKFDPSLPSLFILTGSTTSASGGIFNQDICFVLDNSSTNTFSNTSNCTIKKNLILKTNDNSLVGYWDMETLTPDGTKLKDLSGNGNDGSFSGGMIYNTVLTGGLNGKGLLFNGSGNVIEIGNKSNLKISYNHSVTAIVRNDKPLNNTVNSVIFSKHAHSYTGNGYRLVSGKSRNSVFINYNGSSISVKSTAGINYDFTVITGVKNGNNMRIYENGILKSSIVDESLINVVDENNNVLIGAELSSLGTLPGAEYFSGVIDDIKVYNRALSDEEVKQQAKIAGF